MKKSLLFGALFTLCSLTISAVDVTPVIEINWKANPLYLLKSGINTSTNIAAGNTSYNYRCYGSVRDYCGDWVENVGSCDTLVWVRNTDAGGARYDKLLNAWYGGTAADRYNVFYVFYNNNDPIGQTFQGNYTLTTVLCMNNYVGINYNKDTSKEETTYTAKIISSQESGGWCLGHYPTNRGLFFDYCQNTNTEGGITNTTTTAETKYTLTTGNFYHIAVVVNRDAHNVKVYVNGEFKKTTTFKDNTAPVLFPNCGNPRREKNMWFCLGGDANPTNAPDNYSQNVFV